MIAQYDTLPKPELYPEAFGVPAPVLPDLTPPERSLRARRLGVFIRRVATEAVEPERELVSGQWGLVPPWVKSASDAKLRSPKLINARAETVSTSHNFHGAWVQGQRCIVPMMSYVTEDWRSGKNVPTRIIRVDGKPMGVAGLWERWKGTHPETGAEETIISYTLLTVNANQHALMHRYQQPGSEKRMPAILNEGAYGSWLNVRHEKAREFLRAYAANWLTANPVQTKADRPV